MLKFFRIPFASSGDKTAVPDAVDVNGFVSYTAGYGYDYQRQKTDPAAKNIERDKMNEIFFDITTAISEIQAQGVPDFITSALNGGTAYSYGLNAIVRYSGELYISIAATNIALPTDATKWALLPTPARIQAAAYTSAVSGGTADAITAAFTPAIAALPAAPGTLVVRTRAGFANATATPTFSANGLTAKTIVKGNNLPLAAGDIAGAGAWIELVYDATLDKWVLQNPATGVSASGTQYKQVQAAGTPTVAANALTLPGTLLALDFRSGTANDGSITTITGTPSNLVVPSGATLGTINGVASRLVRLAINNAGTIEQAVINEACGFALNETGVISTTAISSGANSASVAYSTNARTNVPYRVIGYLDSTQATAGTWATAPSVVQGAGGQALTALAAPKILVVQDQRASGTDGSASTASAYVARTFSTVVANSITGASLASNQITLPAGTYKIHAVGPGYGLSSNRLRLRNITDSTTPVLGVSDYSAAGYVNIAQMDGTFTITAPKVFEVQHFSSISRANGFGLSTSSGDLEVYSSAIIEKVA